MIDLTVIEKTKWLDVFFSYGTRVLSQCTLDSTSFETDGGGLVGFVNKTGAALR